MDYNMKLSKIAHCDETAINHKGQEEILKQNQ